MSYSFIGYNTVFSIIYLRKFEFCPYFLYFLSSYDSILLIRSTIGLLSNCNLISFCSKLKAHGLLEVLKIHFRRIVNFRALSLLIYFCQFFSLAFLTTGGNLFLPTKIQLFTMVFFPTNGFLALGLRIFVRKTIFGYFPIAVFFCFLAALSY